MKLNGNLVLNSDSTSEIQNVYFERLASTPTFDSNQKGRLVFNTTDALFYYNNGAAWVSFATGGNAANLQTEVNSIEASLGTIVSSNGVFNSSALTGVPVIAAAGSVTEALTLLADKAASADTLAELGDVTISTPTDGQFLKFNGTAWVNNTLTVSEVSDLTASAAELNILDGATLSTTELNFVDGVTSGIQGQLDLKQPLDTGLTSLASLSGTGIIVQTADNIFAARTLVAPTEGLTISDPAGIAGQPTFALANDLAAIEGLTSFGYVVRTADGSATTRALAVVSSDLVITGASDGVSTDTTFGLATVTQAATGSLSKVTVDSKGRVVGNTPVVTADITALVDTVYVNVAGDTMTGDLNMGGNKVAAVGSPTVATDAATKGYVDSLAGGLSWQAPVTAVVAAVPTSGMTVGNRYLNTTDGKIYTATSATAVNAGDTPADGWALFDKTDESGYVFTGTAWVQFTGTGQITAGDGLSKSGNVLSVNLGAGIAQLPTDEVGIDIVSGKAVQLTGTNTGDQLTFVLDGAGLEQSASGLKISAGGVTNAMLLHPSFTINGDVGTDALVLGDTLQVKGDSVQGISTLVTESPAGTSTFTLTIADASSSQKGVATFATADFAVTAGNVVIKAGGVDNAQLAFSTVGYTGTTGAGSTALGSSFSVVGGSAPITTVATDGSVTINVADATDAAKGLASFDAADFSVTAGAVSLVGKALDSLTDVTIDTPVVGQTLVYNGGTSQFENQTTYFLYDGSSASTHVVGHNIGQKYCNVTIVETASDEVVIPQSIHFDSADQLTVTFTSPVACKVIVTGVKTSVAV